MRRFKNGIALAAAALVVATVGIALASESSSDVDCKPTSFDRAAWSGSDATRGDTPTARQREADELIACKTLVGASAEKVTELLGSPDERDREGLAYQLGPERGPIKVDSEYLDVRLVRGKVVSLSLGSG